MIKEIGVLIVGCGLIGEKRAKVISKKNLVGCYDLNYKKSKQFSKKFGCKNYNSFEKALNDKRVNCVFVCTFHDTLSKFAIKSIKNSKNVLIEKPGGKNIKDIKNIIKSLKKSKAIVQIGYNHRYHPSIVLAKNLILKKKNR